MLRGVLGMSRDILLMLRLIYDYSNKTLLMCNGFLTLMNSFCECCCACSFLGIVRFVGCLLSLYLCCNCVVVVSAV